MSYTINVERGQKEGTLTFSHGNISVSTSCWWDLDNKIDAGTYTGYATWMSNKQESSGQPCPWKNNEKYRPGIYFGKRVPSQNGTRTNNGIFIHKGLDATWSQGCIVCAANDVLTIWNAINPKDTANVTIVVADKESVSKGPPITGPGFGWSCIYTPGHQPYGFVDL